MLKNSHHYTAGFSRATDYANRKIDAKGPEQAISELDREIMTLVKDHVGCVEFHAGRVACYLDAKLPNAKKAKDILVARLRSVIEELETHK